MSARISHVATPVAHLVGPGQLKVVNGQLAFAVHGKAALRLDPKALTTILCYGRVGITDAAFDVVFASRIDVSWFTPMGNRCHGRLAHNDPRTTRLRVVQHRAFADPSICLAFAQTIVTLKIQSLSDAARHYQRHGVPLDAGALAELQTWLARCQQATALAAVRGYEGTASAAWFRLLGQIILPPWTFASRVRRPPTDPINALLSLGYTWLVQRAIARIEARGLEPNLGALHDLRPGRPSLACDLIEPLRVPAVDRWVIRLANQGPLAAKDFVADPDSRAFRLQPGSFGRILHTWEKHWTQNRLIEQLDALVQRTIDFLRGKDSPAPPLEEDEIFDN